MAEILSRTQYDEYESFVSASPYGSFYQSINWLKVKDNWQHEVVVSRDSNNKIVAGMVVLIQTVPGFKSSFLYSPRGPVCDLHDREILADLISAVKELAKKYNAHIFKIDPNILISDDEFINIVKDLGFVHFTGGKNFETIQSRFNYRLYINNRTEEELFANFHSKTRYNIRVAQKHGVEVKICSKEHLDDFIRIMRVTGERDKFNIRPKNYFVRMLDSLGDNVRLYMAFYQGKAIAGAITTNYAGQTCYVYGASDNNHRNVMPNYLVQWEMIKWAVETGCYVYDFQGVSGDVSDPTNPLYGLYRFKKGFNGQLDELAGEFDLVFKPVTNKLINIGIDLKEKATKIKSYKNKKNKNTVRAHCGFFL